MVIIMVIIIVVVLWNIADINIGLLGADICLGSKFTCLELVFLVIVFIYYYYICY